MPRSTISRARGYSDATGRNSSMAGSALIIGASQLDAGPSSEAEIDESCSR